MIHLFNHCRTHSSRAAQTSSRMRVLQFSIGSIGWTCFVSGLSQDTARRRAEQLWRWRRRERERQRQGGGRCLRRVCGGAAGAGACGEWAVACAARTRRRRERELHLWPAGTSNVTYPVDRNSLVYLLFLLHHRFLRGDWPLCAQVGAACLETAVFGAHCNVLINLRNLTDSGRAQKVSIRGLLAYYCGLLLKVRNC